MTQARSKINSSPIIFDTDRRACGPTTPRAGASQRVRRGRMASCGPSLPPGVDGRVRACLHLSLRGLAWTRQYPGRGRDGFVRAKWWGQTDGGAVLKPPVAGVPYSPNIGRAGDVSFPVQCPLKKLVHYLSDARHLALDVVDAKTQRTVGRAKVPFKVATAVVGAVVAEGEFDVQDAALRTIGTLQVCITLEPPPLTSGSRAVMPSTSAYENVRKSDAEILLDAGLESTAAFVANEQLAQAGLGGGSIDPTRILRGEPPLPLAPPRTANELFSPMMDPRASSTSKLSGATIATSRGRGMLSTGSAHPCSEQDDKMSCVLSRAEQLRDRIAKAAESGSVEAALPPALWASRSRSPAPLVSSLSPTWSPDSLGHPTTTWEPSQLFNPVNAPQESYTFPPALEPTLASLRSLRLYA